MRSYLAVFAVAPFVLAGCVAEPSDPSAESTAESRAPLTTNEIDLAPAGESYEATVRPSSPEQSPFGSNVVTHSSSHNPVTASAHFALIVNHDATKP